jgi:hypothetical protein
MTTQPIVFTCCSPYDMEWNGVFGVFNDRPRCRSVIADSAGAPYR